MLFDLQKVKGRETWGLGSDQEYLLKVKVMSYSKSMAVSLSESFRELQELTHLTYMDLALTGGTQGAEI